MGRTYARRTSANRRQVRKPSAPRARGAMRPEPRARRRAVRPELPSGTAEQARQRRAPRGDSADAPLPQAGRGSEATGRLRKGAAKPRAEAPHSAQVKPQSPQGRAKRTREVYGYFTASLGEKARGLDKRYNGGLMRPTARKSADLPRWILRAVAVCRGARATANRAPQSAIRDKSARIRRGTKPRALWRYI